MSGGSATREAVSIEGPAGRLEALLDVPARPSTQAVAVVCHPHPQHQGTMLNKVVHTICRALNDVHVPALRFNFRGVGASEGAYADGKGEVDDLLAAAGWLRRRHAGAELWLAGFSFGAAVAIAAARPLGPRVLVSVAPPVTRMAELLTGPMPDCRWIVIQGTADDVVAAADVEAWVGARQPRPDLVLLPDVDHFFHGRLTLLREALVARLPQPAREPD